MIRGGFRQHTSLVFSMLLAIAACATGTFAQSGVGAGQGPMPLTAPATAAAGATSDNEQAPSSIVATVKDFAWLTGTWRGEWGPRLAEIVWTAPQAGVMTGAFSLIQTDKVLVIELFTLVQTPAGVDLYIRHFTPELAAWEKTGPTKLSTSNFDAKTIGFDNAVDGKPKRLVFVRADGETYTSRSEIVPETGDQQVIEITYHKVLPTPVTPDKAPKKKK